MAMAFAEAQFASNDRLRSEAIRDRAADFAREESGRADQERERAAPRAQQQARFNCDQLFQQFDPSEHNPSKSEI